MSESPEKSVSLTTSSLPQASALSRWDREIIESRNSKLLVDVDLSEVPALFTRVCVLVNCPLPTNTDDAPIGVMLWEHILKYHRSHTVKSFLLAFEYNVAGKYEKRVEHYNSLSAQYISDVLNSFEVLRREANRNNLKTVHTDHAMQLQAPEVSDDTMLKIYTDHIEQVKSKNMVSAELMGAAMFDWLVKSGRFDDSKIPDGFDEQWRKEARKRIFEQHHISPTKWARLKEQKTNEYTRYRSYIIAEQKRLCYVWWCANQ